MAVPEDGRGDDHVLADDAFDREAAAVDLRLDVSDLDRRRRLFALGGHRT
jgi:hypothetical protein